MLGPRDRPAPGPTYMSKEQQAQFLDGLRTAPLARPSVSRPTPFSRFTSLKKAETTSSTSNQPTSQRPVLPASTSMPTMSSTTTSHRRTESDLSTRSTFTGRPLARPPSAAPSDNASECTTAEQPYPQQRHSIQYLERGARWMEKQEVRSLRMALEDMDIGEEERKIHAAAQDEAAELVWKHRNPKAAEDAETAPYANPDVKRDYRGHLREGSYQRSHSRETVPIVVQRRTASGQRSASGESQGEGDVGAMSSSKRRRSIEVLRKVSPPLAEMAMRKTRRTPSGKTYGDLAEAVKQDVAIAHRRSSSGSGKRILSGEKKMFMHPNDRIWEDPQEQQGPTEPAEKIPSQTRAPVPVPTYTRKNPFARVRMQAEKLERANSEPILPTAPARHNTIEIQKNPPSQSKRPWYMSNEPLPPTPPRDVERGADEVAPKTTSTKDGKEIRGDDIRAATSKQRKDYSPKLPRPTAVSDKPGRPIVSFRDDWKRKEVVMEEVKASSGPSSPSRPGTGTLRRAETEPAGNNIPHIAVNDGPAPPIPKIVLPDEPSVPSMVLPEESVFAEPEGIQSAPVTPMICVEPPSISIEPPTININGSAQSRTQPPSSPQAHHQPHGRPLPHHAATSPLPKSIPHYTPSVRQSGALCAHCALPIAGRVLSAAEQRFHPSCFVCQQCHTNLELVAFYPEPENKRTERLDRIEARQNGLEVILSETSTPEDAYNLEIEDGDPSPRFYCHLDFHELFSPRCKSCKTPIEGEVIVACGAEWHAGHFFCAQCGDPFDSRTPFVEKDGYAWCVGCYTNRYSSKCRKCRKPVTDTVVKALEHDWHAACFVCMECNGEFQDGRYFLRGESQDPVCVGCEERRLKA